MANMIPISTVTVGSGGISAIEFTGIPQNYTDLQVVYSVRTGRTSAYTDQMYFTFNGSSASYTWKWIVYDGTAVISRGYSTAYGGEATAAGATANTFGNVSIYIPNYGSANYKSYSVDSVTESNAAYSYPMSLEAGLWSNTSPVTSIKIASETGNTIQQYSSATLYGIRKY